MRRRTTILLALVLAACGGEERVVRPAPEPAAAAASSAPQWQPAVDVAVLRTVGDLPPAGRRVEIVVDAKGALTVDGRATDLAGLREALRDAGAGADTSHGSDVDALLVLDRGLPWRVVQLCMQECAAADVSRLFFAVRHAGDGEPGAFAAFLPSDVGVRPERPENVPKLVARVRLTGELSFPSHSLGAAITRSVAQHSAAPWVEIDAAGEARLDLVLSLADAAAVGGARALTFNGTPGAVLDGGLSAEVERLSLWHLLGPQLQVLGAPPPDASAIVSQPPEAAPRVVGAYAGFPSPPSLGELEERVELVEDER